MRKAVQAMLPGFDNLRVKRNPSRLVVTKNGIEYNVNQLSDGEKCTLALIGDLARRIAMANPNLPDPLEGVGIVLIDEIELHMHPSWQRRILPTLRRTFPNIQFIITTHSPQVLGEVDDNFNIFMLSADKQDHIAVETLNRMDGFDSNYILEKFMDTNSANPNFQALMQNVYNAVAANQFDEAERLIAIISEIVGVNHSSVIKLEGCLKRGRLLYAKNH